MIKAIIGAIVIFIVSSGSVLAQNCGSVPNTLVNGQPADATQVMANFNALRDCINSLREKLTASRTYYVNSSTGNDSNNCLSTGSPCLTIQRAVDLVASIDLSLYDATVQLAAGTYTAGATISGSFVGRGTVTIRGDTTTPANVLISTTSRAFYAANYTTVSFAGLKITTTSGQSIEADTGAVVTISGNMDFGSTGSAAHVLARSQAVILFTTPKYTISGSAVIHWQALTQATIRAASMEVTLVGIPAFQTFAFADRLSYLQFNNNTFVGTATGTRFSVVNNAIMFCACGSPPTSYLYLPGNAAGSIGTGGIYM